MFSFQIINIAIRVLVDAFIKKILRQLKASVKKPPIIGASEEPRYTAEIFKPITLPLFSGGNAEIIYAINVADIMAAAMPCANRMAMRKDELGTNAHKNVVMAKNMVPYKNIFVLPQISPSLQQFSVKIK